uniref:Uncharacterized protein n=1 Tax=Peronospora matthiolae TaxID=2874970 RepID=A0AAV1UR35_9STRA
MRFHPWSSSSKLSSIFVYTGRIPYNPLIVGMGATGVAPPFVEYASRFIQHPQQVIEQAHRNLLGARLPKRNNKRADNPFKVKDLALFATQELNISHATAKTMLRSRKFVMRFIGPFAILEVNR